jgi:hypothetical protein
MQAVDMKFLHALKGCTKLGRFHSEEIKREFKVSPLIEIIII